MKKHVIAAVKISAFAKGIIFNNNSTNIRIVFFKTLK